MPSRPSLLFFFHPWATTPVSTLSLHDALPIFGVEHPRVRNERAHPHVAVARLVLELIDPVDRDYVRRADPAKVDRKSTRLNSSHVEISYAVFCLKKKKNNQSRQVATRVHPARY